MPTDGGVVPGTERKHGRCMRHYNISHGLYQRKPNVRLNQAYLDIIFHCNYL